MNVNLSFSKFCSKSFNYCFHLLIQNIYQFYSKLDNLKQIPYQNAMKQYKVSKIFFFLTYMSTDKSSFRSIGTRFHMKSIWTLIIYIWLIDLSSFCDSKQTRQDLPLPSTHQHHHYSTSATPNITPKYEMSGICACNLGLGFPTIAVILLFWELSLLIPFKAVVYRIWSTF